MKKKFDPFNKQKIETLNTNLDMIKTDMGKMNNSYNELQAEYDRVMELVIKPDLRLYGKEIGVQPLILPVRLQDIINMARINSVMRTITINLKNEIFRRKPVWEPRFTVYCPKCKKEYNENVEKCTCGHTILLPPDTSQQDRFETFLKTANKNKQSAIQVFKQIEEDFDTVDDGYLLLVKDYIVGTDEIMYSNVKEITRGDPVMLRLVANEKGEIGNRWWVCLVHRFGREDKTDDQHEKDLGRLYENPGKCEICGRPLYEVHYVAIHGGDQGVTPKQYYVEGEIIHSSKFSSSLTYGYPPVLSVWKEASTLLNMAHYVNEYYKQMRVPKGALFMNTMNPESLYKKWDEVMERMKLDPHYIPMLATQGDSGSKNKVEFVKFIDSLTEMQYGPSKDELRQRISAIYGVSNILMNDSGTSGGMNNEGLQIKVSDRAIQSGQSVWNENMFPMLMEEFGVTHWNLMLLPNEEADEMKLIQLKTAEAQHAQIMLQMGFDVKLNSEKKFEFSGEAQNPMDMMGAPPAPEGAEEGEIEPGEDLQEGGAGEELDETGGKYSDLYFGGGDNVAKGDDTFLGSDIIRVPGEIKKLMPWKRSVEHGYILKEVIRRDGRRQKVWCKPDDEAVKNRQGRARVKPELQRTKLNYWARPQQTIKKTGGYVSKWEGRENVNIEKPPSPLKRKGIEMFSKANPNIHMIVFKDRETAKDSIGDNEYAYNKEEKMFGIVGSISDIEFLKALDTVEDHLEKQEKFT